MSPRSGVSGHEPPCRSHLSISVWNAIDGSVFPKTEQRKTDSLSAYSGTDMETSTLPGCFRCHPAPLRVLLWSILFGSVGGSGGGCSSGKTVTLPEKPPEVLRSVQYDTVYVNSAVDNSPEVRGGMEAVVEEMESPDGALQGVDGRVEVQFVVSSEGEATNVQVVQAGYPPYEREARRVILTLDFLPGRLGETTVPVRMTLPFTFHKRKTRVYGDP